MRMTATWFLFAVASVAMSLSSADLRSRYGEPNMERFSVRPGICLSVEYGSDHLTCVARLESPRPMLAKEDLQVPLMPSETVSEVIEEVVPTAMRGKLVNSGSFQSGCNVGAFREYEHVSILRATHDCEPDSPNRDASTTVNFKRDVCPKQQPLVTQVPIQTP
jgi:hypothetical protein